MTTTTMKETVGIRELRPGDRVHAVNAWGKGRKRIVDFDATGTIVGQAHMGVYKFMRNDADGQIVRLTSDCRLTRLS